jgi:hypothetical protein
MNFDHERDCSRADTAQDITITQHEDGAVSINQYDGSGVELEHCVYVPAHAVAELTQLLLTRQEGVVECKP